MTPPQLQNIPRSSQTLRPPQPSRNHPQMTPEQLQAALYLAQAAQTFPQPPQPQSQAAFQPPSQFPSRPFHSTVPATDINLLDFEFGPAQIHAAHTEHSAGPDRVTTPQTTGEQGQ